MLNAEAVLPYLFLLSISGFMHSFIMWTWNRLDPRPPEFWQEMR